MAFMRFAKRDTLRATAFRCSAPFCAARCSSAVAMRKCSLNEAVVSCVSALLSVFLSASLPVFCAAFLSFASFVEGVWLTAYRAMASSQNRTNRRALLRRAPWRAVRVRVCRMRLRADGLFAMMPVTFVCCPRQGPCSAPLRYLCNAIFFLCQACRTLSLPFCSSLLLLPFAQSSCPKFLLSNAPFSHPLLALPRGRIEKALAPLLLRLGLPHAQDFEQRRELLLATEQQDLTILRVRSFDVATLVALGGADLGIVGRDVLNETGSEDLYAPLDLKVGACRLCLAAPKEQAQKKTKEKSKEKSKRQQLQERSHIRVATKYPNMTKAYFAKQGMQAECIKLHGSVELAPTLGLASHIVDLVDSGKTLEDNGLEVVETLCHSSCLLVVGRMAMKLRGQALEAWIERFERAMHDQEKNSENNTAKDTAKDARD